MEGGKSLERRGEERNLRRYPRVPVNLKGVFNGQDVSIKDVSMYGLWLETVIEDSASNVANIEVVLSDGARVHLSGTVVDRREGGVAIRCRPRSDNDLVLWIHLILAELADSPLHANADIFGPLFR